ncbi:hypothetical protein [Adhaeretor mobilis]|uniref:Uncharacterized protein n=1 Tax=Adhaeretor mobilis TaxID=1930276 RepID=A0A517MZC0_9BACT|nr:hypothetical protein [Adhaeretor mobilis]QDT00236.1 hypothetical protein HG15A2_35720 [Adhaeretor mobilis]
MSRTTLKHVILYSVVCLWATESTRIFASDLFATSDVYSSEAEMDLDQDEHETKCLHVSSPSSMKGFVSFLDDAEQYISTSQLLSISRWHLRGPPVG